MNGSHKSVPVSPMSLQGPDSRYPFPPTGFPSTNTTTRPLANHNMPTRMLSPLPPGSATAAGGYMPAANLATGILCSSPMSSSRLSSPMYNYPPVSPQSQVY